jgi:integrase
MASLSTDKNGNHTIQFMDGDKRPMIRLGKIPKKNAQTVKVYVEKLISAKQTGSPIDAPTAEWLKEIGERLHDRLAALGLVPDREPAEVVTLGMHLDSYFAKRTDVKSGTATNWGHTRRCLLEFFTADRDIATITEGDAKDFERWLKSAESRKKGTAGGLAFNTGRKRISNAKQFFADAVSRRLITHNPFSGLKGTVGSNRARDHFIDRGACDKILKACPTTEWKLIFALARFGGLRCPSEILALRWEHINWADGRMLVHAPKTEHHEGKETRLVPIFPEVRKHLDDVFHELPGGTPGDAPVITRYRDASQNLRTTFVKIIVRAGLEPWPKLFQNLRASRSTELADAFPGHVAEAWLGHSAAIANKHYRQVTDEHFAKAAATECMQIPMQQTPATARSERKHHIVKSENPAQLQGSAASCGLLREQPMGDEGFEPPTSTV